jgi:hypothetical protein
MISTIALRGYLETHPSDFFTAAELATAIDGDEPSVRNELSGLWVEHMKPGDFAHQVDHTERFVVMKPGDPATYRYAPGMDAAAWGTVVQAYLSVALSGQGGAIAESMDRAAAALESMRTALEG